MANYILRPDEYQRQLIDIDLERLVTKGIRGILLDLDNTLVTWHSCEVSLENKCWLAEAKYSGMNIGLISNNRTGRVRKIAAELNLACYAPALKPFGNSYERFLKDFYLKNSQVAVIGDQLFTDIWGGRRHGMYTILVEPLGLFEFPGTKLTRFFEALYKQILWK